MLIIGLIRSQSEIAAAGRIIIGLDACATAARRTDSPVGKVLLMSSHLHDFAGMLLMFVIVGYIVMQVPEWSVIVVVGTLVGYYAVLNLYRGSALSTDKKPQKIMEY